MRRVLITTAFEGYPDGKRQAFAVGETPRLADAFADMIVSKGLAKENGKSAGKTAGGSKGNDNEAE